LNKLIKRSLSGIVFVTILLVAIFAAWWAWALLAGLISIGISLEIAQLFKKIGIHKVKPVLPISTGLIFLGSFSFFIGGGFYIISFSVWILGLMLPFIQLLWGKQSIQNAIATCIAAIYIGFPFGMSALLLWTNQNPPINNPEIFNSNAFPYTLISLFILLWSFDSFAYLTGSLFGKHKILPEISPKKSWEGFFGGLILSIGIALILMQIWGIMSIEKWIGLTLIIAIFGSIGDFLESKIKRIAQVKDSGNLIPGHGGLFDRFDSFLMIIPFATAYLLIVS
jgi:phosphatidate cytidylyltransferase